MSSLEKRIVDLVAPVLLPKVLWEMYCWLNAESLSPDWSEATQAAFRNAAYDMIGEEPGQ